MALTRQVITALLRDGNDVVWIKNLAIKIADESNVSGSLLTVESNHFCVLKPRGVLLNVYDTGQYALTTPDMPLLGWQQLLKHVRVGDGSQADHHENVTRAAGARVLDREPIRPPRFAGPPKEKATFLALFFLAFRRGVP
jgi:hypothetical protein